MSGTGIVYLSRHALGRVRYWRSVLPFPARYVRCVGVLSPGTLAVLRSGTMAVLSAGTMAEQDDVAEACRTEVRNEVQPIREGQQRVLYYPTACLALT